GHPGMCLGAADPLFVLWSRLLRFDPARPDWADRDRFVLSAGHGSMLLYSMLHLAGYDLPMDDVKRFRQRGSRAAGHPERGLAPGVEVTTGPLGQGFAHGVGLALARRMLAARFNRPGHEVVSWRVFALCGDGDMMEGVTCEAASLAGHLGLGEITYLYDSNRVTIEGSTDVAFGEDVARRFEAMGWHVAAVDGYDHEAVAAALAAGVAEVSRPSLVVAGTEIGHGAPTLHGSARTHGSPLGAEEIRRTKEAAGWAADQSFVVPEDVGAAFAGVASGGAARRADWEKRFAAWREAHPDLAAAWDAQHGDAVPGDLDERLVAAAREAAGKATRVVSNRVLQAAFKAVPGVVGGSADLGPSNETVISGGGDVARGAFGGANLHFGVREHAMGSIANGIALSGAFRPYAATFLVFSDYMKPALRLAALMKAATTFVYTHDSYAVGEDGPTHQPIEHLWMLRSIPGMKVFRPADAVETAAAWSWALRRSGGPCCIALTRQAVPAFARPDGCGVAEVLRGGYVVAPEPGDGAPDAVIVATGSEVAIAIGARDLLAAKGVRVRVVSMPCLELFREQPATWRDEVVPPDARVATLEAGATVGWGAIASRDGLCIGLDRFGESAPAEVLAREFGFTADAVAERILTWIRDWPPPRRGARASP
ncbi:MAG: transketolase, partial [Deltaproteobacteria bacterium]|nr:transketolase [Deltaproteobacteria bacterium]